MVQPILSDDAIKQRVMDELRWDPAVDSTNINVTVRDGFVTLSGTVPSFSQKQEATRASRRVYGVLGVTNNVDVWLPPGLTRSDQEIKDAVLNALAWDTLVPSDRLNVSVDNGWVTLTGNVDWHYQKEAAENDVRDLVSVKGVINLITVSAPFVSPADIKSKIEDALKRTAEVEANRINVNTMDSKVILTGTVDSWAEKQAAENAAWSAQGVTDVENDLIVSP